MKCYKVFLIGIALIVIFLTGCVSAYEEKPQEKPQGAGQMAEQKDWNYGFHYGSDYWKYYDFSNSYIPTQENYEALVAVYIPQIENLLGAEDWYADYDPDADTVFINLEMGSTPHSMVCSPSKGADKTIEFSILLSLKQINIPTDRALSHELTHSVLGGGKCFSNSLEEGMCDYVSARIGVNYSSFFEEYDIDILDFYTYDAKLTLEKFYDEDKSNEMLDSIGRAEGYTYSTQTQDGRIWYECSQSFVEYLVRNYGMEQTVQLIREGKDESDYQTYFGISFEELKKEWTDYVRNYESMHTMEEYMQMTKEFFQGNGG